MSGNSHRTTDATLDQRTAAERVIADVLPKLYQFLLEPGVGMVPLGAVLRNPPGSFGGRQSKLVSGPSLCVMKAFVSHTERQHQAGGTLGKRLLVALPALALTACGGKAPTSPPVGNGASGLLKVAEPADNQSRQIVDAAQAFLASLTDEQRKTVLFPFSDGAQRARWSNFPTGFVPRAGVPWGQLSPTQRAALTALLRAVLSPKGVTMVVEQMNADNILARKEPNMFGANRYCVSFLGTPALDRAWTLQFGGHHLAINATVAGPHVTLSPSLTGGEPLKYVQNGKSIYIVENEVLQSQALMRLLTPAQLKQAVRSSEKIDLVLGPGHDGQILQPEGLPGSAMTSAQKVQFLKLIEARLGFLNADDLKPQMAAIAATLDQTYYGWWGATTPLGAAYYRINGPRVLIEFSPQDMDGDPTNHAHNMFRDPTNEYGSAWTRLR